MVTRDTLENQDTQVIVELGYLDIQVIVELDIQDIQDIQDTVVLRVILDIQVTPV